MAKRNREKLTILERKMKSMAEIIKYAQNFRRWNRRKENCGRLSLQNFPELLCAIFSKSKELCQML